LIRELLIVLAVGFDFEFGDVIDLLGLPEQVHYYSQLVDYHY